MLLLLALAGTGCVGMQTAQPAIAARHDAPRASRAAAAAARAAFVDGDCARTQAAWWHALLLERDPHARAAIAREFAAYASLTATPAALQVLIRARLDAGDLAGSDALLRELDRSGGDAQQCYRLRSRMRHLAGDAPTAWAFALLAREHAADPRSAAEYAAALWRQPPADAPTVAGGGHAATPTSDPDAAARLVAR